MLEHVFGRVDVGVAHRFLVDQLAVDSRFVGRGVVSEIGNVGGDLRIVLEPGLPDDSKVGQFVEVKITHWPTARFQPQGDIVEVVGNYMAPGMEIDVALRTYDIPQDRKSVV